LHTHVAGRFGPRFWIITVAVFGEPIIAGSGAIEMSGDSQERGGGSWEMLESVIATALTAA
jgi:hypothetical protein